MKIVVMKFGGTSLADISRIKNVASIQGFGQDVTIRTITAGSYNTTTVVISESNSDATVKAVFRKINADGNSGQIYYGYKFKVINA